MTVNREGAILPLPGVPCHPVASRRHHVGVVRTDQCVIFSVSTMSSGFTWKRKADFEGDLPRPHVDHYDGMLFGPASSGTPVINKWYDQEYMRNVATAEKSKANSISAIRNIVSAGTQLGWKRIKLTLGSGVPGAVISAGVNFGLLGPEQRLIRQEPLIGNALVPQAQGRLHFMNVEDSSAYDLLVKDRAREIQKDRARARLIRNTFLRKSWPKLLRRRRARFAIRDARQTLYQERRGNRIAIARGLRRRFAGRRRRLARGRFVLRRFFRYGRRNRRYWGRNLVRVRGGTHYGSPDY